MDQIVASAAAISIALILWGLGRKPSQVLFHEKINMISDIPRIDEISLLKRDLKDYKHSKPKNNHNKRQEFVPPSTPTEKVHLRQHLKKLISQGPNQRLEAVQIASSWDSLESRKILRIGLKDSDSRIVKEAAAGIQKYKRNSKFNLIPIQKPNIQRLPRNVSLMR